MRSIAKQRHKAAVRQSFHCFYCGFPMWESSPAPLIRQYGLTPTEARSLQCTGEHLHPRSDGGSDHASNIVAACKHCNSTRHRTPNVLSPGQYQKKVQKQIGKGRWFSESLIRKVRAKEAIAV